MKGNRKQTPVKPTASKLGTYVTVTPSSYIDNAMLTKQNTLQSSGRGVNVGTNRC